MADQLQEEMAFAADTAWHAGRLTLGYFQTGVEAERKADDSPVTIADREAETAIRDRIRQRYPDDGIVGEEFGTQAGTSGRSWYVDPIDGTKSFVQGVPFYGVLIGLVQGEPGQAQRALAGAVYFPALDEMIYAARGQGSWWNGRRAVVSDVDDLAQACVCYTSSRSFAAQDREQEWQLLGDKVRLVRGWGDCYGHILVATGRAEVMLDPVISPWDCGPLPVILEEAGGTFGDWTGTPALHGADAVSTNGHLFAQVIDHLRH